jgi:hypothetical protein
MVVMGLCICLTRSKTGKQPISEGDKSASEEPTLCIALKQVGEASIYENPQAEEKACEEESFLCMTAYNLTVEKQAIAVTSLFLAHDVGFQVFILSPEA